MPKPKTPGIIFNDNRVFYIELNLEDFITRFISKEKLLKLSVRYLGDDYSSAAEDSYFDFYQFLIHLMESELYTYKDFNRDCEAKKLDKQKIDKLILNNMNIIASRNHKEFIINAINKAQSYDIWLHKI